MKPQEGISVTKEEEILGRFLVSRGGPFYDLQKQLGLLREEAARAGPRAFLFVILGWGVPLVLSVIAGNAFGSHADNPYLLEVGVWARFFVAIGLFTLMERQAEEGLRIHLVQFGRAPLLAPGSIEPAAEAVTRALKRRDAGLAEFVCLLIAILLSFVMYARLIDSETSSWIVRVSSDRNSLTIAGWWCFIVSNPLFGFLLFRWLWRLCVWSILLRELASQEMRLVATHPDGRGGLAFIGLYPNTFAMFVFAISCVVGAAIAQEFITGDLSTTTYGIVMGGWLLIVLTVFNLPLLAFNKPLKKLKQKTYLAYSALATRHNRTAERDLLGTNISASEDAESQSEKETKDPFKEFAASQKLSAYLVNKSALIPISAAALIPLVAAGATQLPVKELLKVMKRLLLL